MKSIQTMLGRPVVPLTIAMAAVVTVCGVQILDRAPEQADSHRPAVGLVDGAEVTASSTVEDWARVADYVVLATVTSEQRIEPVRSETSDDGDDLVGRDVTVEVDKGLWRAADVSRDQPAVFAMPAFGWERTAAGDEIELAPQGGSRLEVGHRYVLAITWKAEECSTDGEDIPPRWTLIGSSGALPADGGVVGEGEFEGSSMVRSDSARSVGGNDVLRKYRDASPANVADAVERAKPGRSDVFEQADAECVV